ncbi:major facilitator superfamily MFS_1 [Methanoplanus limicola DSM 2279]|uniref:Major facilitator superfamily MFS_1 n=2 Tax=Methanoplanus limicola TaxID=2315 RepID=H1Z2K6_9EURY|nr:major facilitator superfamily MFS_1 [Methanoplanus limicola DSM 2279]
MGILPGNNNKNPSGDFRQKIMLATVCFSMLMISLNSTIVCVALPTIAESYHVFADDASWVVLAYLLSLTGTLIIFGRLADVSSPKRIFITGLGIFGFFSFMSAFMPNLELLVAVRFCQGIGAAMLVSVGGIIVNRFLPQESAGKNLGLMTCAIAVGYVVGPPLGGFISSFLSWNWVFLISVPLAVIILLIASFIIPEIKKQKEEGLPIDLPASALFFAGMILSVVLLSYADHLIRNPLLMVLILAIAAACWVIFIRREKRSNCPLLPLHLLGSSGFALAILVCLGNAQMDAGSVYLYPFYLETGKDLSAWTSGLLILIFAAGMGVFGFLYGKISSKRSSEQISIIASVILLLSFAGALISMFSPGLFMIAVALFLGGSAIGLLTTANNHIVTAKTPPESQGVVWSMIMTISGLGSVTGIAVFGLLFSIFVGDTQKISELTQEINPGGFGVLFVYGMIVSILLIIANYILAGEKKDKNEGKNEFVKEEINT